VNALFPTILQPRVFKNQKGSQRKPALELNIFINTEKHQVLFIDEMEFITEGLIVKCDDEFLGYILSFVYDTLEKMKTNLTGMHPIFKLLRDEA
jgi:hypothetical protein